LEIIPQSSVIGAEVRGLDLSVGLEQATFDQLNRAFLDHQILFFRDQQLTARQYNDFAERFGSLKDYLFADGMDDFPHITEIVKTETETEGFGSYTLFADMYSLYDDLSAGLKAALAPLRAINSASGVPRDEDIYEVVKSKNSAKSDQFAIHPVIRRHDETGRNALYVNGIHTLGFEGLTRAESLPMLEYLYQRVTRPEYSFRLRWQADTLALWDNRCTQHYALNDYHGYRRVMHRIIVEGPIPQ